MRRLEIKFMRSEFFIYAIYNSMFRSKINFLKNLKFFIYMIYDCKHVRKVFQEPKTYFLYNKFRFKNYYYDLKLVHA